MYCVHNMYIHTYWHYNMYTCTYMCTLHIGVQYVYMYIYMHMMYRYTVCTHVHNVHTIYRWTICTCVCIMYSLTICIRVHICAHHEHMYTMWTVRIAPARGRVAAPQPLSPGCYGPSGLGAVEHSWDYRNEPLYPVRELFPIKGCSL